MKLGKYDVTIKNVWAYIQGNSRKITNELGPDILKSPKHIQEQILWRKPYITQSVRKRVVVLNVTVRYLISFTLIKNVKADVILLSWMRVIGINLIRYAFGAR